MNLPEENAAIQSKFDKKHFISSGKYFISSDKFDKKLYFLSF